MIADPALIENLKKEIRIRSDSNNQEPEGSLVPTDPLVNAQLEIKRFQRDLLIKLHKEGEFSDDALRQVEREMDVDELRLTLKLPRDEQPKNPI